MIGIGVLGSLEAGGSEVGGVLIRAVCGQEGSRREESYNKDSRMNSRGKAWSRRDFLVDIGERVGGKDGEKDEGEGRREDGGVGGGGRSC